MRRPRLRGLIGSAAGALALALLAGCGSDESDGTAAPEATIEAFLDALRDGDGAAACEQLDQRTLGDLEASGSCEEVLGKGLDLFASEDVQIPDYEIGVASVEGDTAEVTLTGESTDDVLRLELEDGEWKLDGATALDQFHPDSPELATGVSGGEG